MGKDVWQISKSAKTAMQMCQQVGGCSERLRVLASCKFRNLVVYALVENVKTNNNIERDTLSVHYFTSSS